MNDADAKATGLGNTIAIMIATGLVLGILVGFIGGLPGLPSFVNGALV